MEEQFYLIWPLVVLGVLRFTRSLRGALRAVLRGRRRLGRLDARALRRRHSTRTGPTSARTPARSASSSAARWPSASCCSRSAATRRAAWPRASCGGRQGSAGRSVCGVVGIVRRGRRRRHLGRSPRRPRPSPTRAGSSSSAWRRPASSSLRWRRRAASCPRFLSLTPVRYVGRISYGLYIWHWPHLHLARPRPDRARRAGELFAVRVLVTFARVGGVVPPRRAPDPHGDLRAPVAGLGGRARRRSVVVVVAGRRRDDGDDGGGQHGVSRAIGTGHVTSRPRRRSPAPAVRRAATAGAGAALRRLGGADPRARPGHSGASRTSTATCSRTRGSSAAASSTGPRSSCWGARRHAAGVRRLAARRRASPRTTSPGRTSGWPPWTRSSRTSWCCWRGAGRWWTASTRARGPTS